ncbi:hypothetical protein KAW65_02720 [candidate division WOR-3 bacterium]|nr:hypothetical protein [candidate division WOR-3 bacterium]
MGQRKSKFAPLLLGIIVGVIILVLSITPISPNARSVVQYILIGIFFSFGIIGWRAENKRSIIIANIILWCAIIAAIVITLI